MVRSIEQRQKASLQMKEIWKDLEYRKKSINSMKGNKNALGYKHTNEAREKISKAHKGKSSHMKGKKHSEESRKKMSKSHKGQTAWNKGLTKYADRICLGCSCNFKIPERELKYGKGKYCTRKCYSKNTIAWNKGIPNLKGKDSPLWKGDKAKYSAIHSWVRRFKPKPSACTKCNKKVDRLELANLSGEYKREVEDYKWLCVKCHRNFDGWYEKVRSKVIRGKDGKFYKKNTKEI